MYGYVESGEECAIEGGRPIGSQEDDASMILQVPKEDGDDGIAFHVRLVSLL